MPRELDKRSLQFYQASDQASENRQMQFRQRISQIIDSLPQVSALEIEKFDEFSGNPSLIVSHSLERQKGNYAQRALDFLQRIHPVLGLAPRQSPEFVVGPSFGEASSGATAVHVQQQYKGIPIFQATTTVRFTPAPLMT